ncbi:hypothetical protein FJZ19_01540 [Candidatus Pacearchaeota archaeon]|nr:hypothetical protein [Candidatus Pacearchaeota archaeon]
MKQKYFTRLILFALVLIVNVGLVFGAASFQVTSFSCSPKDVVINDVFSCTAQVKNAGDAAGTISTVTLYPDAVNWLENTNYPQASGTSVTPGQSTEITFTGLKAVKSGNNGFSKIMLDSVTDTYVADSNTKVKVINVVVTLTNSVSSAQMGQNFTVSAEVTAGGNIDVTLTFSVASGGCSIGNDNAQKTITGMQDGSKQSRTWTVTQGNEGACKFSVSATAVGSGIKTDTTPGSITCPNCPVPSSTPSSGGGGSGGGGWSKIYLIGELTSAQAVDMAINEKVNLSISGKSYIITLENFTQTDVRIKIGTEKYTIAVGDEVNIDLNGDYEKDISVKPKYINFLLGKVQLIFTPYKISGGAPVTGEAVKQETAETPAEKIVSAAKSNKFLFVLIVIFAVIAVLSLAYYFFIKNRRKLGYG